MKEKKMYLLAIIFGLVVVSCSPGVGTEFGDITERDADFASAGATDLPHNLLPEFQNDLAELSDAPLYTLNIKLLEDDVFRITGSQEVVFTNTEDVSLDEIYFKLIPNMGGDYLAVSDVSIDNEPVAPQLEFGNTVMRLDFAEPLAPGDKTTITMALDIVVPTEMGGNYGLYIFMDDILALDAFFPIIPVFNDEGWNVEPPPANADVIFSEAAFFDVTVDAPEDYVIAAGGQEVNRKTENGRQTVQFQGGPHREFYLAASPNFVSESMQVSGTLVTSYFLEEFREAGEFVLETAAVAIENFSTRFGNYPFTEMDLVSTPMQAGGMEYSNITALGLFYYDPESTIPGGAPAIVFLEGAAAHEIAHMWFYCQVLNDQIDHPWQDESLVQYATYLYYVDRYGEDAAQGFKNSLYGRWDRVNREPIPIDKPAQEYRGSEYSGIIYGRGAFMFDAMREKMGDQTFNQFLRTYVAQNRWQVVEPQDLKDLAEDTCGCDLSEIYKEWGLES